MGLKGKISLILWIGFFSGLTTGYGAKEETALFWPAPPAKLRISFVSSVYGAADLGLEKGFFRRLKQLIAGQVRQVLYKPVAVAVDSAKSLYVCDTGIPAVHIFNQKEKRYQKITSLGGEELLSPVAIAISREGLIFVADSELGKVFCLEKNGKLKFALGQREQFLRPVGLAVYQDLLYVVDSAGHKVWVFKTQGALVRQFGTRGRGQGEFNYPTSIAIDSQGRVYLVDALNFRVQVFNQQDAFLYSFGQPGDSSGFFARPKGIALDSFGHIYVSDGIFDNLQIFGQTGHFLLSLGESGSADGKFWIPSGIAIDEDNYIYLADSYNRRIQIFRYLGQD